MKQHHFEPEGEQVSLFDMFSSSFPIPEDGEERLKNKPKRIRRSRETIENLQSELDLMLDVLSTPDAIFDTPAEWTDQDIHDLRVYMLFRHLRFILDGRTAGGVQRETWDWIVDDSIHPFCFRLCVEAFACDLGYADENETLIDAHEVRLAFYFMAKRAGQKPPFSINP